MRIFFEIILAALLVTLAWERPYKAWFVSPPAVPKWQAVPRMQPTTPWGAWMWDKNRRTALDRPAYDQREDVVQPSYRSGALYIEIPNRSSHANFIDEKGRRYWLDRNGKRHYQ